MTVRERARDTMRAELAEEIYDLFAERGFDEVTVDEASQHAGISRATFFRYFGSKEEVVLVAVQEAGIDLGDAVRRQRAVPGESVWGLLLRAFDRVASESSRPAERVRARIRMIVTHPALRSRLAERRFAQEESLTAALAERIEDPADARPLAVAALAVFDLAWRQWAFGGSGTLHSILGRSFGSVASWSDPVRLR